MPKYDDLKYDAIKALESRGHDVREWNEFTRGYGYTGFHHSSTPSKANAECIYCKMEVQIDTSPPPNGIEIGGEAVALNCTAKHKNPDGLAITTYSHCYICGKPSKAKTVTLYGFHPICERNPLKIKPNKKSNFKALAKLPKFKGKTYPILPKFNKSFPILSHVYVIVKNGYLCFVMTDLEKVKHGIIEGVKGDCNICVPRDVFGDTIILLSNEGEDFSIAQDDETMSMIISTKNSKTTIKGIDKKEFPNIKEILNPL